MKSLHDLPVEILDYIFTLLRLEDWKQASLVCHQWMVLCSSRKSLANVVLTLIPEKSDKSELCRILSGSIRKYRNIIFEVYEDDDYVIPIILETFHESLECVKIKGYYEMVLNFKIDYLKRLFECIVKLKELRVQAIIEIDDLPEDGEILDLPRMPYLETLYLEFESLERACFDWCQIAPNLKHLYLGRNRFCTNFNQLMSFYSQQLCSLGIAIDGSNNYAFGAKPVKFPQLKNLTVLCWAEVELNQAEQFFKSFSSNLTELTLGYTMIPEVLASTFVLFPSLETVRLYFILPENGFHLLSKLPKLKHLFLFRVSISYSGFELADCFNSLQQLSLKHVEIDVVEEFFKILPGKMPNVTSLEITDDGDNETSLVCANLLNLRRLTVSWECKILGYFSCCDFNRLEHLRELRLFYNSLRSEDFSWMSFARCPSVHKLLIPDNMVGKPTFISLAGNPSTLDLFLSNTSLSNPVALNEPSSDHQPVVAEMGYNVAPAPSLHKDYHRVKWAQFGRVIDRHIIDNPPLNTVEDINRALEALHQAITVADDACVQRVPVRGAGNTRATALVRSSSTDVQQQEICPRVYLCNMQQTYSDMLQHYSFKFSALYGRYDSDLPDDDAIRNQLALLYVDNRELTQCLPVRHLAV
ncbi:uncharacterized protein LOC135698031 [Ochlerotatus camptorhynchus]|uniref:uncharacterized protein LOC135698031 n=1 Tax=Ochlerotatus camptorhynchus TaxID=644619 RepID=UPI0031D37D79